MCEEVRFQEVRSAADGRSERRQNLVRMSCRLQGGSAAPSFVQLDAPTQDV